jgi:hypothetical protein
VKEQLKQAQAGTGAYVMTRKDVGEAYRAARKVRIAGDVTVWRRRKGAGK